MFEKLDKPDEAILAYRQARDHNGGADALRPLFSLLARRRRFEDLKRLRSELLVGELTPDIEQIAPAIALMLGEKEATEEMVEEMVKKDPQGLNTRIFQAGALARLGEPKQAEEVLQTLIQQQPDQLRPRITMLMLQISQKQPQRAAEVVEQIRENIKTEQPELLWAGCYALIGDRAKATQYYKEALQKWPDNPNVQQLVVNFFLKTGHPEEAEAALRELLKREPKHAWARRELAQLLSTHSNDPIAWTEALKLIGDKPSDSDTAEDRLVRATVLCARPTGDAPKKPSASWKTWWPSRARLPSASWPMKSWLGSTSMPSPSNWPRPAHTRRLPPTAAPTPTCSPSTPSSCSTTSIPTRPPNS